MERQLLFTLLLIFGFVSTGCGKGSKGNNTSTTTERVIVQQVPNQQPAPAVRPATAPSSTSNPAPANAGTVDQAKRNTLKARYTHEHCGEIINKNIGSTYAPQSAFFINNGTKEYALELKNQGTRAQINSTTLPIGYKIRGCVYGNSDILRRNGYDTFQVRAVNLAVTSGAGSVNMTQLTGIKNPHDYRYAYEGHLSITEITYQGEKVKTLVFTENGGGKLFPDFTDRRDILNNEVLLRFMNWDRTYKMDAKYKVRIYGEGAPTHNGQAFTFKIYQLDWVHN